MRAGTVDYSPAVRRGVVRVCVVDSPDAIALTPLGLTAPALFPDPDTDMCDEVELESCGRGRQVEVGLWDLEPAPASNPRHGYSGP